MERQVEAGREGDTVPPATTSMCAFHAWQLAVAWILCSYAQFMAFGIVGMCSSALYAVLGLVGLILLFIWTVLTPGTPGTNRFGPSPIDPTAEVADVFGAEGNAPAPTITATSGVGDSGEYKFACPQCGKLNLMSEVKCTECGTRT